MEEDVLQRVLILGGGFAGLNTAARLEKLLERRSGRADHPGQPRQLRAVHADAG